MPIIEYISFGLDEALEALQTQHVHTLLQLENEQGLSRHQVSLKTLLHAY